MSCDLAEIAEESASALKIILMSATTDTPIFQTMLQAVRSEIPDYDSNYI